MKRRHVLGLGAATVWGLAVAAPWVARPGPALAAGPSSSLSSLAPAHRTVLVAWAQAVLQGSLPEPARPRAQALDALMDRLAQLVQGLPAATRDELVTLLTVLSSSPGRRLLARLRSPWEQATADELAQAVQALRSSRWSVRQQVYHGLRDLICGAYFADEATWPAMGYPGPMPLGLSRPLAHQRTDVQSLS